MADLLIKEIERLDFAIEKSMRYHQRRRGVYEWRHKVIMFLVIVLGSAAFYRWANLAIATTVLATIDLVWGLSHKARDHEMLFARFSKLAIDIRTTTTPDKALYNSWVKERINIETGEPPIHWALEADCDNEVRRAWDRDKKMVKIGWWSRLTMNWLRHEKKDFPMISRAA